jgi:glycosyltransferase involved in cell wall biosynthesis
VEVEPEARSVLFLAAEPLEPSLTGPTRRIAKLAEALSEHASVTLAAPAGSVFPAGPYETLEVSGGGHDRDLATALSAHDVTVTQVLPSPRRLLMARRHARRLVVDMIAPLALEVAEIVADERARRAVVRWRTREMIAHLAAADLVLCSNEKQRDLLIGAALAEGSLDFDGHAVALESRIAVVPHGIDPVPAGELPALRPEGIAPDDRLVIWAGGMWSWLDPLTAIKAIERLRGSRPDVKLSMIGFEHPAESARRAHGPREDEAMRFVRDRGLDGSVVFTPRWLERDDYLGHLLGADVGVVLHGQGLEGRFASRTRIGDYLSTGLPVVCSRGDTMSEFVAAHDLGRVVEPLDAGGCARAFGELTSGERRRLDTTTALEPLRWPNVARPLVEFCLAESAPSRPGPGVLLARMARDYPAFLSAIYRIEGADGLGRALVRRGARTLQRS